MALPPPRQRISPAKIDTRPAKDGSLRYTARIVDPAVSGRGYQTLGTKATEWEAERLIDEAWRRIEQGLPAKEQAAAQFLEANHPRKDRIPFNQFVDEVFLTQLDVRDATRKDYTIAGGHLKNYFGTRPLSDITNPDVRRFIAEFRLDKNGKERAPNTRRKVAQRLRQVFNVAVAEGYIQSAAHPYRADVGRLNRLPSRPASEHENLLPHHVAVTILGVLEKQVKTSDDEVWVREAEFWLRLLDFAMWSGLRLSELLGLTIDDLVDTGEVRVRRQWGWNIHAKQHDDYFTALKSIHASRKVPLRKDLYDRTHTWALRLMEEKAPEALLFPRPTDTGWALWGSPSYFHRKYNEMSAKVYALYVEERKKRGWEAPNTEQVMTQNFHQYRHLYAAICLAEEKFDVNTVSKWLGHHSPAFTYEVYSGLVRSVADDAYRKMRELGAQGGQVDLLKD